MLTVDDVALLIDKLAPSQLAEDWDNVGLLVGHRRRPVRKIMTCLTVTPATATEAIERKVDVMVSHHPLPFRPLKRLTSDTIEGRLLLDLIAADVAIISPHTAFDSALLGINERLAEGIGLSDIVPLIPAVDFVEDNRVGAGRCGRLPAGTSLDQLVLRVKRFLALEHLRVVGPLDREVTRVAIACGSGGEFLDRARAAGCDGMLTGEASFHACLAAQSAGMGLVLAGHFASERFAVEYLAEVVAAQLPGIDVWACRREEDPIRTV
ncbi:MAG: Nif3-like dinuclear metal center hexameric protein [Pirellulales bacterium]